MRIGLSLFLILALFGCTQPKDTKKDKPKPNGTVSLEQMAFESFQNRDNPIRSRKLRAMKGTRFDGKRMEAIARAGAEAAEEAWRPVAAELAKRLDAIPQDDQETFDAVLEEIAKASDRAGAAK